MKKIIFTLAMIVCTIVASAQQFPGSTGSGAGGSRYTHDFTCMDDAVFDQIPVDYIQGYYCDVDYIWPKVADNYEASGIFDKMTFWGSYDVGASETFLIEFYDGEPGVSGTNVTYTFTPTVTPIPTGYYATGTTWPNEEIYRFEVDFGVTIPQLTGWVSISRTSDSGYNDEDGLEFNWVCYSGVATTETIRQYEEGTGWVTRPNVEQFFCLGAPDEQAAPVSNWALYLGIGLILVFTVLRIKRVL